MRTFWQTLGRYEFEVKEGTDGNCYYTGWIRCVGGRLADGRWPQWNEYTGEERF